MAQPAEDFEIAAIHKPGSTASPAATLRGTKFPSFTSYLALATALAIAGMPVIWASARTGSLSAGIALLRGNSIYATVSGPLMIDSESGTYSATVSFSNVSSVPLRIVGYNNPCACFRVEGLPLQLAPHERKSATISISTSSVNSEEVVVFFLSDCRSQQTIPLHLATKGSKPMVNHP